MDQADLKANIIPTRLDEIKNLRIAVQAGGVVKGFTPTRRARACHVG